MATVYAPPVEIDDPPDLSDFKDENGRFDFNAHMGAEEAWIATVQEAARAANSGDVVGEVIRFPIADGYALYVVWKQKPLQLIHLAVSDAWSIPVAHERGLTLADVRAQVKSAKALAELFGRSS